VALAGRYGVAPPERRPAPADPEPDFVTICSRHELLRSGRSNLDADQLGREGKLWSPVGNKLAVVIAPIAPTI
jgi:hypothetical protein